MKTHTNMLPSRRYAAGGILVQYCAIFPPWGEMSISQLVHFERSKFDVFILTVVTIQVAKF